MVARFGLKGLKLGVQGIAEPQGGLWTLPLSGRCAHSLVEVRFPGGIAPQAYQ